MFMSDTEYMYYLVETTIAEGRCRPIKHAAEPSNPGLEAADASQALADADAGTVICSSTSFFHPLIPSPL